MCHKPARAATTMNEVPTGLTSRVNEKRGKLMAVMAVLEALRIVERRSANPVAGAADAVETLSSWRRS
jgi:hypothetical protein